MKNGVKTSVIVRRKINVQKTVTNVAIREEATKTISTKIKHITNTKTIKKDEDKKASTRVVFLITSALRRYKSSSEILKQYFDKWINSSFVENSQTIQKIKSSQWMENHRKGSEIGIRQAPASRLSRHLPQDSIPEYDWHHSLYLRSR